MAQAPVMPLWTDALVADTTHLSPREFGCYMLLLIATWRNNGQPFADNDKILARICRMPTWEWKSQIRKSLEPFFNLADGCWRQKRLEKEWTYCSARASTSRRNGSMGGRPPKAKSPELNGTQNPAGSSQVNLEETQKEPALTHTHTGSKEEPVLPLFVVPPSPEEKARVQRGTRLAPDWSPDLEDRQFAHERGLDPDEVADDFRDYWSAKDGNALKRDWRATWRRWCREQVTRNNQRATGGNRPREDRRGPVSELRAAARAAARFAH